LIEADVLTIRKRRGVVLERTVRELRGISCIALEEESGPRKEIACTRSFGSPVSSLPIDRSRHGVRRAGSD
jgi:DNA polymerase V